MNDDEPRSGGGRVDVDETLPSVEVPGRILNELYAHAIETLPEECCGLIVGTDGDRFRRLHRCRNDMTKKHRENPAEFPRDGTRAFYMSELDYMRVHEEAEAAGENVTVVYHSHVGAGAYLSEMDLAFAEHALFPFPQAAQIVLAVWDRSIAAAGIFERDAKSGRFMGSSLEVDGS